MDGAHDTESMCELHMTQESAVFVESFALHDLTS